MAAVNPNGEMQYWDSGFPFQGVLKGTNNVGEMQFWDSGFPQNNYIPQSASASQIKTIMGLDIASVKTIMGLPIASVKTLQGLTNV